MDYKMPPRPQNSNKGTFGKILNIAGSEYMPGAAYLSSVAALRVGAGYVKLLSYDSVLKTVAKMAPEIVLENISSDFDIEGYDVISFGCGCGISHKTNDILEIISKAEVPTVIDADGINVLAENYFEFNNNVILTPHPKEASRLLKCSLTEILDDIDSVAKRIAVKYNCITVLKTHNTVVTDGQKIYRNHTGNSALAKAGSGDVLCGIISGLLAQEMSTFDAAVLGVYLHGLTGELAAKDLSEYGVLASDLHRYIPFAIKTIQ